MNTNNPRENREEEIDDFDANAFMEEELVESGADDISREEDDDNTDDNNLVQELDNLRDSHLRLRAEYENFRKRTLREKADLIKHAGEKAVIDFLEIADDFDRALSNIPETQENKELRDGVELIRLKMLTKLRAQGVQEMEVVGDDFSAEDHEAVAMVPVEEQGMKGKIIDCVQKGYKLHDKVIRHPKVVVGQ